MPFVNVPDGRIEYFVEGSGPPLLLIHGVGNDARSCWYDRGYIDVLSQHFTTVAASARGYGQSSPVTKIEHMPYALYRDDFLAVMDDFGADEFSLLGYSRGGVLGMMLAMEHPERVSTLVAGGANLEMESYYRRISRPADQRPRTHPRRIAGAIKRRLVARLRPPIDSNPEGGRSRSGSPWRPLLPELGMTMYDAWARWIDPLCDTERAIERLTMPTLLWQGEQDALFSADVSRAMVARMDNAELQLIPGIGHDVIGRADLVLPVVEPFLLKHAGLSADEVPAAT
jgi:pimeloyl-ACP methyl ester carboxylesterase